MRCPGWPCDTQHAILPEIWRNDPVIPPFELIGRVKAQPGDNVCITGGEPTMQPAGMLEDFGRGLLDIRYTIDVFTNGSLVTLPAWMVEEPCVCIIMDWKLNGSGEAQNGVDIRLKNLQRLGVKDAVKFVIASDADFMEAVSLWKSFKDMTSARFWVGVAWGKYAESQLIARLLYEDLPWKVNVQVHKYIWEPDARGT
jgi:7-carboxy-7-deazaguanine synthase